MGYNTIDDILGEVSEDILLQLIEDDGSDVTVDMIKLVFSAGDLSNLTSDQAAAATKSAATITKALDRANGEVDGFCGKRYQVPFSPLPDFVKALALDIAVYNIFSRREMIPENRKTRRDNAVKNLEQIAKGLVTLGVPDSTPAPETFSSATPAVVSAGSRQFSRNSLKGF